ncbi:hypothetical protein ACIGBH_27480 [Streptomyces sp. NPDC085929]|uniref:hypothetical protein n=1 Tax=Streptomyces sp. NPDC085929 TaxID=3365739 RepID=UPI0037D1E717
MTEPRGPASPKPRAPKPIAPIDWARQQQTEHEQRPAEQPARHTVDTITSDALDQLYAEIAMQTQWAVTYKSAWHSAQARAVGRRDAIARAEQAEAALTRARGYAAHLDQYADATASVADRALFRAIATDLRAALDPQEPTP